MQSNILLAETGSHGCEALALDWKWERGWDTAVHVRIRRSGGLVWVVATRLSCPVFVNGGSVDSETCAVSWRIEDGGDGDQAADGVRKRRPLGPMFAPNQLCLLPRCDRARNGGSDGEWRGATAAFSRSFDVKSMGGRAHGPERRERGGEGRARSVEKGSGAVRGRSVVQCREIVL